MALAFVADAEALFDDAHPRRMADLPARAERAGAEVTILPSGTLPHQAPFDIVLCDAPCSGSGSWRRDPEGKWRLTPARLDEITDLQTRILDQAARLVAPEGLLAYATCSLLARENEAQRQAFLDRAPRFSLVSEHRWSPAQGTDGFYAAVFARDAEAAN